ncbi:hypothetical protein SAMN05216417_12924 [Nitrosospira multiformis]|uniref:Uncharacterized protein n=1 Tax=Nitrosospira multiformis TaxID=1231 RepID=A0A1I7IWN9_9PROT|nr:hypothetical protein SAMN05216417_12924 [Nitrosospira multiformis]
MLLLFGLEHRLIDLNERLTLSVVVRSLLFFPSIFGHEKPKSNGTYTYYENRHFHDNPLSDLRC